MTAVANPPSFAPISRPAWSSGSQSASDDRGIFPTRKIIQRTNSSSSSASSTFTIVSANGSSPSSSTSGSSASSVTGDSSSSSSSSSSSPNGQPVSTMRTTKRPPQQKAQWASTKQSIDAQSEFLRGTGQGRQMGPGGGGPNGLNGGVSSLHQQPNFVNGQMVNGNNTNGTNGVMSRPAGAEGAPQQGQPVLYLMSLNGTFERKTISVPFTPNTLRIGRQTNKNTTPNTVNGYFDSKVLSRQHAEIWADRQGKIWIRDIKSSNGTFVNGARLSAENRESEPHELQTNDHLELGIDIVSEDQKSVVHHKVAAKVEHAGFITASNNLLDMNFGDLDPANGALLAGSQMNNMPFRGRTGSQASIGTAGRMAPAANMNAQNGLPAQRSMWLTGPSTEAIVKKIHQEMRNAKQQSQDLQRTQEFIKALLANDNLRGDAHTNANAHPEGAGEALKQVPIINGNRSLRGDIARFSDPPAPPPQQPLPEKPDVPSLKRSSTERSKAAAAAAAAANASANANANANGAVLRPENVAHLQDALSTARRELTTQHTRLKDLENKLREEQEARKTAEDLARRLNEAAWTATADTADAPKTNGVAKPAGDFDTLAEAFELGGDKDKPAEKAAVVVAEADAAATESSAEAAFRTRVDAMMTEMEDLKKQLRLFRERAEKAEAERDADRETLADMVKRIRQRDEENARLEAALATATAAAAAAAASAAASSAKVSALEAASANGAASAHAESRGRSGSGARAGTKEKGMNGSASTAFNGAKPTAKTRGAKSAENDDVASDITSLSRTDTITPASTAVTKAARDVAIAQGIPYASMMGVVLMGMGLMAYLNGWQPTSARLDR